MSIDYKQKYFDLKDKEEAQLQATVEQLVKDMSKHNTRHEADLRGIYQEIKTNTDATQKLADHVATQNGRLGKLEKIVGRKINFNDPTVLKTARIVFICVAIVVVVILTGGDGLTRLLNWVSIGG